MDTKEIIELLKASKKSTPVQVFVKADRQLDWGNSQVFGCGDQILFGEWEEIGPLLDQYRDCILDSIVLCDRRQSALPLKDLKGLNARIEPGATIRHPVEIGDQVVVMMGAVINVGAIVGENTLIDMNAVLGARAIVGKRCHIGAGAVLAGVIEPPSRDSVIIEDDVLVGANAVILEGVRVGKGSVVAAGAVVIKDVPEGSMVAGVPAKRIKSVDRIPSEKREILDVLRHLK